ncbi:FBP domain-containing protein [Aestuariimicrobium soli]|uniref:FBP domain-containing protein n=1 Tax=Aestuariimicrobium soli TaxID=2035834 RepID=UPI003EB7038D
MKKLSADEIRGSFVNCSKGVAQRLTLPDLDTTPWSRLDLLGWLDPSGSGTAYLVTERVSLETGESSPIGFVLRQAKGTGVKRQSMCSLCTTVHSSSDVALMTAARPGASGRAGNTRGNYLCADLACSLYVRGLKKPARVQPHETITEDERIFRLRTNLSSFVERLAAE